MPGRLFTKPLTVQVTNALGEPVSGMTVDFSALTGKGFYITPPSIKTGPSGLAAVEVRGPEGYNQQGSIMAKLQGTPLAQTFTLATNDTIPGVHFEIESTLGQTITAGQPFGFIVKLVNGDGSLSDYTGTMTTIWEIQSDSSWSGIAPKNIFKTYVCTFTEGVCYTPSSGPQAMVLYDSRKATTVFMGDGNAGYMDVFAYDIVVQSDVPNKVVITDALGGPAANALVIKDKEYTADDVIQTYAAAITDASGNYISDAGSVSWSSTRNEILASLSGTVGETITFNPTKSIPYNPNDPSSGYGYIRATHSTYPVASTGKLYVGPGALKGLSIEKVGGGSNITAGEAFGIAVRAVDNDGNTLGQSTKGVGYHGQRTITFSTANYKSGPIVTGGSVPVIVNTANMIDDGQGNLLPGVGRQSLVTGSLPMFFNFGEASNFSSYNLVFFDATDVAPTLTLTSSASDIFPQINGSMNVNVSVGPPHHIMIRNAAGAAGVPYCEVPAPGVSGTAMSVNLKSLVLAPFNDLFRNACKTWGTLSFQAGQAVPNIYYAIEDAAGNFIANIKGNFSTSASLGSSGYVNFFGGALTHTDVNPTLNFLTFNGTEAGDGLLEIFGDYDSGSGTVTYRSYLSGTINASAFHHHEIMVTQTNNGTGSYGNVIAPYNVWSDSPFTLSLTAFDAFNNPLNGNLGAGAAGTALMTVSSSGPIATSPDGSVLTNIPSTQTITMILPTSTTNSIYSRQMTIGNKSAGTITFSFTGATNGAPDRSLTINAVAGPLSSIDIRTGPAGTGTSIVGQPVNLTTDNNPTYYITGLDSGGNLATDPVGTWSVTNLLPDNNVLLYGGVGSSSQFQPQRAGTGDKIKVTHTYARTTLTAESGPVTLTFGQFNNMKLDVPPGPKIAGVSFDVTIKLRDQKNNVLTHINGPQDLVFNIIGVTPTLLGYTYVAPANGPVTFTNGEATIPFTFYNSKDANPRIQISATIGGSYGGGSSQPGDIVITNSTLNHLHIKTANPSISAGGTNQFTVYAEDLWGNQMETGTGSNLRVGVNLTNAALTTQDITATSLGSPTAINGTNDTTVEGDLTNGAATFDVTSTIAGIMTATATTISGGTTSGTNAYDTLTILPLSTIAGIQWGPSQAPLSPHNASPTAPLISSTGAIAAQILDTYGNVITTNNSETISVSLIGASQPFYGGTTTRTVASGTATFGDLKYTRAETITLRATVNSNNALTTDASITVVPNGSRQTIVVLPNQTFTDGTGLESTAITGTPFASGANVNAGTTFAITVRLVDSAFNTVAQTGTVISAISTFSTTDPNITVSPATQTLTMGQATFNVTIKRRGNHKFVATAADGMIGQLASTQYTVEPLATSKLVVLLPGQTLDEGAPDLANALDGTSPTQTAGVPFNARVVATDVYYNQTPLEPGTTVSLTTSDPNDTHPGNLTLSGSEATFSVTNVTALTSQSLTVSGSYTGSSSTLYAINPNSATQCIAYYGANQTYTPGKTPYTAALTGSPTNKTAGTTFTVTTYAVDNYFNIASYSGNVQLTTPDDPTDTEPALSNFVSGTKVFTIDPVTAGTNKNLTLSCPGLTAQTPATYNIDKGSKYYLVSYFPAFQTFDSTRGHQNVSSALSVQTSANRDAGTQYTVNVVATDIRFNILNDTTTVTLTSSDANHSVDTAKALVAGQASFNLTNYRAGTSYTVSATGTGFTPLASTAYNVVSGNPSKLLVILPGETYSSGRALASEAAANAPNKQTVGFDYQIKVYATDPYFNQVTTDNSTVVSLTPTGGALNYVTATTQQMVGGLATFTVNHAAAIASLTITPSGTGYTGEVSEGFQVLEDISTPTLATKDGTTNSNVYVRQATTVTTITEAATVNAWCLSQSQTTRPVSAGTSNNKTTCAGTSGGGRDALGWYTSRPATISLTGGDGLKTVYLWVADAANNVSLASVSSQISLDATLPATPTITFPIGTHSSSATPALNITGDTDAVQYCLIEQAAVTGAPSAPAYNSGCWSGTAPTTVTMGALGSRKAYLFTKDIADNVSLGTGGYVATIYYDPNAPGAFAVTGVQGNLDTTPDSYLGTTLTPTVVWSAAADATTVNYQAIIKQGGAPMGGSCTSTPSTSTTFTLTGCTLTDGNAYTVEVVGTDQAGNTTSTGDFAFDVDNTAPAAFSIAGATGGTDVTADGLLSNGNTVTANWNDTTGETYYKMLVYQSDQTTVKCALTTQTANVTAHTFTGCALNYANSYYLRVEAWDAAGNSTVASNANYLFTVVPLADRYLVALESPGNQTAGQGFNVTVTAKLSNNATDTSFTGVQTVTFTTTGGSGDSTICPSANSMVFEAPTSITFTNGVATATNVKMKKAETGRTITASSTIGGVNLTGTTDPFTVDYTFESCKRVRDTNLVAGNFINGNTINLSLGQTATVYSIGYDTYGNFIGESSTTWSGTSSIIYVPYPRVGASTTIIGLESGAGVLSATGVTGTVNFSVGTGTTTWTSASTDLAGRTLLGSSSLTTSIYYDTTTDASSTWRTASKSWFNEAFNANRGSRDEFPVRAIIVATDLGLDIIDATTNQLWMRFIAGSARGVNSDFGKITSIAAMEGKIYLGMAQSPGTGGGLTILDFVNDAVYHIHNSARKSNLNLANRNTDGATLGVNADYVNLGVSERVYSLSAKRINSVDYIAIGTATKAHLMRLTATSTRYTSTAVTGSPITAIALIQTSTTAAKLYYAENGVALRRSNLTLPLAADFGATYSYNLTTNAKPADLAITSISVAVNAINNTTYLPVLMLGSASGLTTISENATDTSATSVNYNYVGTGALNPGSGTQPFGTGIVQSSGSASAYAEATHSAGLAGTGTIEFWFRPETDMSGASAIMSLVSKGDTLTDGSVGINFNAGGIGKMELWVRHGGVTYIVASTTTAWSKGQWYHLAGVFKSTGLDLYVNGILENQLSQDLSAFTVGTSALRFGGNGTQGFSGAIDELRVSKIDRYNSVASFTLSTSAYATDGTNNVYLYHFDQNTGTTATATNGSNASLTAGCWMSKPFYKGIDTAVNQVAADATAGAPGVAMTEIITNSAWTEITALQGASPTIQDFDAALPGTGVFFYHRDALTTKDIGVIKINGANKELYLKVR
jgi:hypothetical protein